MNNRTVLLGFVTAAMLATAPAYGFWGLFSKKEPAEAATEAVAAVQGQAEEALSQSALDTAKSISTALASAASSGEQLKAAFSGNEQLSQLLDKALSSARLGDGLAALKQINALSEKAKLTSEQRALVNDLKKDFEIIALGRSFPEGGPVSEAIRQIEQGETGKAVASLGEALKDANLSDSQRAVLKTVIEQHATDLKRLLPF